MVVSDLPIQLVNYMNLYFKYARSTYLSNNLSWLIIDDLSLSEIFKSFSFAWSPSSN